MKQQPDNALAFRRILKQRGAMVDKSDDYIVREEPLEMIVEYGAEGERKRFTLAVTMRTPGRDDALIRGFLLTEGIVQEISQICTVLQGLSLSNSVVAVLEDTVDFDPETQQRHFYTTSSCGVCGKTSIDMVRQTVRFRPDLSRPKVEAEILTNLTSLMRDRQEVFRQTGGIHAAALFDAHGNLICSMEDVGRHNAVDKLLGVKEVARRIPLDEHVLVVSGRAGFELVQKAAVAGIAMFAAVGAPSSLAVELADESAMTLVGFLRGDNFNIYTHPGRITREGAVIPKPSE